MRDSRPDSEAKASNKGNGVIVKIRQLLSLTLSAALLCTLALPGLANAAGGVIWAKRAIPGLEGEIRSVQWLDESQGFVFEYGDSINGNSSTLWTTENGGDTWTHNLIWPTDTAIMPGQEFEIKDVDFNYSGQYGWAVGVLKDGLERSPFILGTSNGGQVWTNQTANLDTVLDGEGAINSVLWIGGAEAWACGDSGIMLAATGLGDGADEWKVLSHNTPALKLNDVCQGYDFGVRRMLCVGDNSAVAYCDYNLTTRVWTGRYDPPVAAGGLNFNSVVWADTDYERVLAVGDHGLFAWSNSSGLFWNVGDTGNDERWFDIDYAGVASLGASPVAYAVGNLGQVRQFTFNSGPNTWIDSDLGPTGVTGHLKAISARWNGHIWAGGTAGTYIERTTSTSSRAADSDRYSTAIAMSADWPDGSCYTVVIATGLDFPDALSASALAGTYECPLLLTGTTLRTDVKDELDRLGAKKVVIVGGTGAVSQAVEDALDTANFDVQRISGSNRYATSQKVAQEIAGIEGTDFVKAAFIARGDNFADALAASPFAYSQKMPVLLTATNELSANTRSAISGLDIETAVIAGGTSAVSNDVQSALNTMLATNGGSASKRWAGTNRYSTAATVARNGITAGWGTAAFVGLSTGLNFPDALGGGAVCGSTGGVLLLTPKTSLAPEAGSFLTDFTGDILEIRVFGGTGVVTDAVKSTAASKIQ